MASTLTVNNILNSKRVTIPSFSTAPTSGNVRGDIAYINKILSVYDGSKWKKWTDSATYIKDGLIRNIDWAKNGNSNEIQSNIQTIAIGGGGTFSQATNGSSTFSYQEFTGSQALAINDVTATNYVTVDIVYKPTSLANGDESIIYNKENCWEIKNTSSQVQWAVWSNTQSWFWSNSGFSITTGQWVHIVLTFDGSAVKMYKNGAIGVNYTTGYGNSVLANQSSCYPKVNARGCDTSSSSSAGAGGFAHFRIYNRALSDSEITTNFNYAKQVYGIT